jgi:trehalose 6-phosphate synthase
MNLDELLVCSHRGPLVHQWSGTQVIRNQSAPGGLVQVILPLLERYGGTWIASVMNDADSEAARAHPSGLDYRGFTLRLLDLPPSLHEDHYRVVSVKYLGRLFHYLYQLPEGPVFDYSFWSAWRGFRSVNTLYAEALTAHADGVPVFVQDYHLLSVGAKMRELGQHGNPVLYFHHVPWCEPDYFGFLPAPVRTEILASLLANDVVSFHARRWVDAFLRCCERYLTGAVCSDGGVEWRDSFVPVLSVPATIDRDRILAAAQNQQTEDWVERFESQRQDRWTLVRVDRADLWKNVLHGFSAFELLLEQRPDLKRRLWFLVVTTPARTWAAEYRDHLDRCLRAAERINQRFGKAGGYPSDPVTVVLGREGQLNHSEALAAMRVADAVLVGSLFDGLNLVAKEALAISRQNPALILSTNSGVYEQLGEEALGINPCDLTDMAGAIECAYEMPRTDRESRAARMRAIIETENPATWISAQLAASGDRGPKRLDV